MRQTTLDFSGGDSSEQNRPVEALPCHSAGFEANVSELTQAPPLCKETDSDLHSPQEPIAALSASDRQSNFEAALIELMSWGHG